jgi:hypothetical protein
VKVYIEGLHLVRLPICDEVTRTEEPVNLDVELLPLVEEDVDDETGEEIQREFVLDLEARIAFGVAIPRRPAAELALGDGGIMSEQDGIADVIALGLLAVDPFEGIKVRPIGQICLLTRPSRGRRAWSG